jgi:hypothetical protein
MNETHLGVLLDVSGSAHPYLSAAIREIEKNFPDAVTVLVMGCGMREDIGKSAVKVQRLGNLKTDEALDKAGARTTLGQLAQAENTNREMARLLRDMRHRDNVYAVYGGDIGATHYGFEQLIEAGVDGIYWFADFQDAVDPKVMERLARELERRHIKLYAHNFAGKPVRAEVEAAVKRTGGVSITVKP